MSDVKQARANLEKARRREKKMFDESPSERAYEEAAERLAQYNLERALCADMLRGHGG